MGEERRWRDERIGILGGIVGWQDFDGVEVVVVPGLLLLLSVLQFFEVRR